MAQSAAVPDPLVRPQEDLLTAVPGAVPILMYHQVSPKPVAQFREYTVTPGAFAMQMKWLAWAGYTPITLDQIVAHRLHSAPLPRRPVAITFDDAFQDCFDYAAPVLQKFSFTATFYVVTGCAGKTSAWTLPIDGVEFDLMSWSALRQLQSNGLECGSHTVHHRRLADISPDDCRRELTDSRRTLEDRLGREVRRLAYPFGSFNPAVMAAAREAGYDSAVTSKLGMSHPAEDLFAIRRVPVIGGESLSDFVCRLRRATAVRQALRSGLRGALRKLVVSTIGDPRGRAR